MFAAEQRTDAFVQAIQAIDGTLALSSATGSKLLVIASDGMLPAATA